MKLKFINLLLASVLLVGSAQVFTSCKDNESDIYANLKEETITLREKLEADSKRLTDLEAALQKEIRDRENDVKDLAAKLDAYKKEVADTYATKKELADAIADVTKQIKDAVADIEILKGDVNKINAALTIINGRLDDLEAQVKKNTEDIVSINTEIGDIKVDITNINASIDDMLEQIKQLGLDLSSLEARVTVVEGTLVQVQADITTLNTKVATLEDFMNTWAPVLPEIQQNAAEALAKANKNAADIAALQAALALLEEQIELGNAQCAAAYDELQSEINTLAAQVANCATLEELAKAVELLQKQANDYYNASIGYTIYMCAGLRAFVEESVADINIRINDLEAAIAAGDQAVLDELNAVNQNLTNEITNILTVIVPGLEGQIGNLNNLLTEGFNRIDGDIADVNARIDAIETALQNISSRIEEVAGRLNSIIIQATDNKVVGTLSLPIGIQSNMLLAYVGENVVNKGNFPTTSKKNSYNGELSGIGNLTADELAVIGYTAEAFPMGLIMNRNEEGKGVLGTVYMTVNPANTSLAGKTFQIVNSQNNALPVTLDPKPSDKILTLGYTRSADNGFYEADALIDVTEENVAAMRLVLNNNFKAQVKNLLEDPKNINSNTVASIAAALYQQLNGVLPSLGIKASWTESDGTPMQVTSQYGMAVATITPLSFSTIPLDKSLPTIPTIPSIDKIQNEFNIWFDKVKNKAVISLTNEPFVINYAGQEVEVSAVMYPEDLNVDGILKYDVYLTFSGIPFYADTLPVEGSEAYAEAIVNAIIDAVNKAATGTTGNINDLNNQVADVIAQINNNVNSLLASMEVNINTTVADVLAYIQNAVNGKLDALDSTIGGVISRAQNLIARINNVLTSPAHYVQPVLLYSDGGTVGKLSEVAAMPTVMKTANADAAVVLVPTTYTLETAVPVYEKFVAVTKAYKSDDATKANVPSVVADINGTEGAYLAQVVPAARHTMELKLKKGYTYEIVYQAVDYVGKVSGNRYYVTVK